MTKKRDAIQCELAILNAICDKVICISGDLLYNNKVNLNTKTLNKYLQRLILKGEVKYTMSRSKGFLHRSQSRVYGLTRKGFKRIVAYNYKIFKDDD